MLELKSCILSCCSRQISGTVTNPNTTCVSHNKADSLLDESSEDIVRPIMNGPQELTSDNSSSEQPANLALLFAQGSSLNDAASSSNNTGKVSSWLARLFGKTRKDAFQDQDPATAMAQSVSSSPEQIAELDFQPRRLNTARRQSPPRVMLTRADTTMTQETLHRDSYGSGWEQYEVNDQHATDGILPTPPGELHPSNTVPNWDLDIFPNTVKCTIHLKFEHMLERKSEKFEGDLRFWYQTDIYHQFNIWMAKELEEMKKTFTQPCDKAYKVYSKQAVFRITYSVDENGTTVQNSSSFVVIDQENMREEIIAKVCTFIGGHRYQHENANLEIHWEYSTLRIEPEPGTTFRDMLYTEVNRKLGRKNFNKQSYIPRSDLVQFLFADVIEQSLDSDKIFQDWLKEKTPEERQKLINYIKKDGARLHLICVSNALKFEILEHWLHGGLSDLKHQKDTLDFHNCKMPQFCTSSFNIYKQAKDKFFTWIWLPQDEAKTFVEHDENVVLPILYDQGRDRVGKESACGEVFKVYIEPDHHCFEGVCCTMILTHCIYLHVPGATLPVRFEEVSPSTQRRGRLQKGIESPRTAVEAETQVRCYSPKLLVSTSRHSRQGLLHLVSSRYDESCRIDEKGTA